MKNFSKFYIVLICIFSLLFSSCANLLQGKVDGVIKDYNSLGDITSGRSSQKQLSTPTQVDASQYEFSQKIVVSWNEVPNAEYYMIERCVVTPDEIISSDFEPDASSFLCVCEYTEDSTYTDIIFSQEPSYNSSEFSYRYYYRITACADGYESSDASDCNVYGTLFSTTSKIDATCGKYDDKIKITWNKVQNAQYYKLYRGETENGNYTFLKNVYPTTSTISYEDSISSKNQGVEYYYKVQAINRTGNSTVLSAFSMGYAKEEGAPETPQVSTGSTGTSVDSISISWNAITDPSNEIFYKIYRTSSSNSQKEALNSRYSLTTFIDTDVVPNVEYYYSVLAFYDKDTNEGKRECKSEASEAITAFLLSPPKSLFVESSDSARKIVFSLALGDKNLGGDYTNEYSYRILSSNDNITFETFKEMSSSEFSINSTTGYAECDTDSVTDCSVTDCNFIKIVTINGILESCESEVAAPSPKAACNVVATRAKNVGGSYSGNSNGILPIKITWQSSDDSTCYYEVYRSTKRDSGYVKLTSTPLDASKTEYIDDNSAAKVYTPYFYKVLALNSLGKGTNYSEPNWGYGALTPEQYLIEYNKTIIRSQKKLPIGSTSKDSCVGDLNGRCLYDASAAVSGALSGNIPIYMTYTDYADFRSIDGAGNYMYNFYLNGNTDTHITSVSSRSGYMDGTMTSTNAWYPGSVYYRNVKIVSSAAGGGYYVVTVDGFSFVNVDWTIGEIGW